MGERSFFSFLNSSIHRAATALQFTLQSSLVPALTAKKIKHSTRTFVPAKHQAEGDLRFSMIVNAVSQKRSTVVLSGSLS